MEVIYGAQKVKQINDFLDKSNKMKIGLNEMRVNDTEMSMRLNHEDWSIPGDISHEIA